MNDDLIARLRGRARSWQVWIDDDLDMEASYSPDNMRTHQALDTEAADALEAAQADVQKWKTEAELRRERKVRCAELEHELEAAQKRELPADAKLRTIVQALRIHGNHIDAADTIIDLAATITDLAARIAELERAQNTPETADFLKGLRLEAAHQRERWGTDHDGGKEPQDWYWLIGYLAGKALRAHIDGNMDKALHHTISSAAALFNWHAAILGKTNMRPGIAPPGAALAEKEKR